MLAGVLINASTKEPLTYKDPCVERGPHIGYDPDATGQAREAVTSFVRAVSKLE